MKRLILFLVLILGFSGVARADDLYRVEINSQDDAKRLSATGIEPIVRLTDGYLVLADAESTLRLAESGLAYTLIATDVPEDHLALDGRLDRKNAEDYPVIFEEDNLRLFLVDPGELAALPQRPQLFPVDDAELKIEYTEPRTVDLTGIFDMMDLETLIALVDQDSLQSYTEGLQGFYRRVAGTMTNNLVRDWLAAKFVDFGYDSIVIDSFVADLGGTPSECQNVLAYKVGTVYPNHHVIVGAHRDAVSGSPGADDNGSGTAGVLEIARVLQGIETDMTIIFALFDAEEFGLYGSYHYVNEAAARGDSIVYMLNMDMIAHFQNTINASLYHGSDVTYSVLWQDLADSLLGINGVLEGNSGGSDHYPFTQRGYPATFAAEYIFSTVYHSNRDSTTYMNFSYMTKMVKASLATAYVVTATGGPRPQLFFAYPTGVPSMLAPGEATTFEVNVSGAWDGVPVSGSGEFHYAIDGGGYTTVPMNEISANHYEATLPAALCDTRFEFYLSAEESLGEVFYSPGPADSYSALVFTGITTMFTDDFETDQGWTVSSAASDGQWDRGVPVGGGLRGDPPTDYDGSGQCYLTDNVAGNSDVDGGSTTLISPTLDMSVGDPVVTFALWYSNDFGADPHNDQFIISMSIDNGSFWYTVEVVGPEEESSGGWYEHAIRVSDFMTPTSQMKVRFIASDHGSGSVVEAAVDAFGVINYECDAPADLDNDGILNENDNCPFTHNPLQDDFDEDGDGDACDDDDDNDGVLDGADNCQFAANSGQEDNDGDGLGNACDDCDCTYLCDLDLDGNINPIDAVKIVNYVYKAFDAREQIPTVCPNGNGDWNNDNEINPLDVVLYVNYVYKASGPDPSNPCNEP